MNRHRKHRQDRLGPAGAQKNKIVMTADQQLTFWKAIRKAPVLTPAQRRLGAMMRGEA